MGCKCSTNALRNHRYMSWEQLAAWFLVLLNVKSFFNFEYFCMWFQGGDIRIFA